MVRFYCELGVIYRLNCNFIYNAVRGTIGLWQLINCSWYDKVAKEPTMQTFFFIVQVGVLAFFLDKYIDWKIALSEWQKELGD